MRVGGCAPRPSGRRLLTDRRMARVPGCVAGFFGRPGAMCCSRSDPTCRTWRPCASLSRTSTRSASWASRYGARAAPLHGSGGREGGLMRARALAHTDRAGPRARPARRPRVLGNGNVRARVGVACRPPAKRARNTVSRASLAGRRPGGHVRPAVRGPAVAVHRLPLDLFDARLCAVTHLPHPGTVRASPDLGNSV